eukprot:10968471-Lingulodinium_polyedra.AAC.1
MRGERGGLCLRVDRNPVGGRNNRQGRRPQGEAAPTTKSANAVLSPRMGQMREGGDFRTEMGNWNDPRRQTAPPRRGPMFRTTG